LNFENAQEIYFSIDGEPFMINDLEQIRFLPMQPIKDVQEEDGHQIIIVRGNQPRLTE